MLQDLNQFFILVILVLVKQLSLKIIYKQQNLKKFNIELFHLIVSLKKNIYNDENIMTENENKVLKSLIIPDLFIKARNFFEKFSFFNPFSPQGMLIFGLITSIYRLK